MNKAHLAVPGWVLGRGVAAEMRILSRFLLMTSSLLFAFRVTSDYSNAGLYLFGLPFDLNLIYFNPILNSIE